jgi:hypothetical protein
MYYYSFGNKYVVSNKYAGWSWWLFLDADAGLGLAKA